MAPSRMRVFNLVIQIGVPIFTACTITVPYPDPLDSMHDSYVLLQLSEWHVAPISCSRVTPSALCSSRLYIYSSAHLLAWQA